MLDCYKVILPASELFVQDNRKEHKLRLASTRRIVRMNYAIPPSPHPLKASRLSLTTVLNTSDIPGALTNPWHAAHIAFQLTWTWLIWFSATFSKKISSWSERTEVQLDTKQIMKSLSLYATVTPVTPDVLLVLDAYQIVRGKALW
jgi:hypothetical protein